MKYIIDIDNTICITNGLDYKNSKPIQKYIDYFNNLYNLGHEIIYCTGRGLETNKDFTKLTETQLNSWGVKYTRLSFKKEPGDIYIDDKALNICDLFSINIESLSIINKNWGNEYLLSINNDYVMKILYIKDNNYISKQYHEVKHETWFIMKGTGIAKINNEIKNVKPGSCIILPPNTVHQIKAVNGDLYIVEASTPQLDDIVRLTREFK